MQKSQVIVLQFMICILRYEGWNFNSGNYLFTTDTK